MEETKTAQELSARILEAGAEAASAAGELSYLATRKELDRARDAAEKLREALADAAEKLPEGAARARYNHLVSRLDTGLKHLIDGPRALHAAVEETVKALPLIASRMTSWADADIDILPRRLRRAAEAVRKIQSGTTTYPHLDLVKNYTKGRPGTADWGVTFCDELNELFEALWKASELATEGPARDELRKECRLMVEGLCCRLGEIDKLEHHARLASRMADEYADLLDAFAWE